MTDWSRPIGPAGPTFLRWVGSRLVSLDKQIHEARKDGLTIAAESLLQKKLKYVRAVDRARAGFR